jgi:RuvA, C-terminal domain
LEKHAAAHDGGGLPEIGRMKQQNAYFDFGQGKRWPQFRSGQRPAKGPAKRPVARAKTKTVRPKATSPSDGRADLVSALVNLGYSQPAAKKAAASATGSDFDSLFRDAIKRVNPMKRQFPAVSKRAERLLRKLARSRMSTKKKKKNGRKKQMPAALRKYWEQQRAKKRAKKAKRRKPVRRTPKRRRKANPRPARQAKPRVVKPPFPMNRAQLKKYARALARATGKRVILKGK